MVLLHGLFGSAENLGALARVLAEHFTVYSLDLPGHGRSPHSSSLSLSSMVRDVQQWMQAHGLTAAHIVGHSLGGKLAMELALTQPELLHSLTVMDISPVHYDPHHNQVFAGLLSVDLASLTSREQADHLLQHYVPEYPVRSFLLKNLVKEAAGHFSWRMDLPSIHAGYPDLIRENSAGVFARNTLFLKGGSSPYIKESHREAILSRFPQTQLKIVSNTGHWLHAEKPELVAKLIEKFLLGSAPGEQKFTS